MPIRLTFAHQFHERRTKPPLNSFNLIFVWFIYYYLFFFLNIIIIWNVKEKGRNKRRKIQWVGSKTMLTIISLSQYCGTASAASGRMSGCISLSIITVFVNSKSLHSIRLDKWNITSTTESLARLLHLRLSLVHLHLNFIWLFHYWFWLVG